MIKIFHHENNILKLQYYSYKNNFFDFLQYFRLDEGEYMGFGLSGDDERTKMVGGDVTIAWMDHATGKFFLPRNTLDYVLDCENTIIIHTESQVCL